jgi:hypothetical protein
MAGLLDIAPLTETVEIRGQAIEVSGLTARDLVYLIREHESVRKLMSGVQVGATEILTAAPDAVCSIIAGGLRKLGDAETAAAVDRLDLDAQIELLSAILRLTMPKGVGPFVQRLQALGNLVSGGGLSVSSPVPTSPAPSSE